MIITKLLRNRGLLLEGRLNIRARLSCTDSLSKANVLAKYFSSVFTNEDTVNVPVLEGDLLPEIPPIRIQLN